jgi:hypothetical protein
MTTEQVSYKVLKGEDGPHQKPLFLYFEDAVKGSEDPVLLGIYIDPEYALMLAESIINDLEARDGIKG